MTFSVLIGLDTGSRICSREDVASLFQDLPAHLKSCRHKLSLVKSGRWFSWHGAAEGHMKEWFAFKMLLKHQYPEVEDVDQSERSFKELRSDSGGLKLALKCMTFQN